ncbi:MAG: Zinc uptake regulation protein Zur, partial [uncultured Microvirga sp.]
DPVPRSGPTPGRALRPRGAPVGARRGRARPRGGRLPGQRGPADAYPPRRPGRAFGDPPPARGLRPRRRPGRGRPSPARADHGLSGARLPARAGFRASPGEPKRLYRLPARAWTAGYRRFSHLRALRRSRRIVIEGAVRRGLDAAAAGGVRAKPPGPGDFRSLRPLPRADPRRPCRRRARPAGL